VHSMKDVPAELPDGFALAAVGFRDEVRDALVGNRVATVAELRPGARIGSSSLRRRAQLLARRPDLVVMPVRGNVNTRLDKLDAGEFDALLLAATGLARLGLDHRIGELLTLDDSLPAAGQGALGIECPSHRRELLDVLAPLNDSTMARCVHAERAVSRSLGADCSMPIAAYATTEGERITLRALLAAPDGSRVLRCVVSGTQPANLGAAAAAALRQQGADAILDALRDR
jgi:hydroxymethylbilane synthase